MAEQTSDKKTDKKASSKGGLKSKLVLVPILLLGVAAGYTVKGGGGSNAEAAAGSSTSPAPTSGAMVSIAPLSLNLADDHYLKVGIAVQLIDGVVADEAAGEKWLAEYGPVVRDLVIAELGGSHVAEFANAEGRETTRQALLTKANEKLDQKVFAIYFTEFIMQ